MGLGVVTGLQAEARLASPLGRAQAGGGGAEGAARAALALADGGACGLLSFGLAGGLSPGLSPGDLVIPQAVQTEDGILPTDPGLNAWLGGQTGHILLGGVAIAASASSKAALHAATGAHAIDLESGAVASVARQHRLPFAALRAICDGAQSDLPPAALVALDAQGAIALLRVLGSLARQPAQIGALLRLSGQAAAARAALIRHVAVLGRQPAWAPAP